MTNRNLYYDIALKMGGGREGGERLASDLFQKAGITGIKYPSGTLSGISDSPYYNYVIFDPKRITIDKINDIPLNNYLMGGQ